jgi:penicillin-binding protein 1A
MVSALDLRPVVKVPVVEDVDPEAVMAPDVDENDIYQSDSPPSDQGPREILPLEGTVRGMGIEMKMGRDGSISIAPSDRGPRPPPAPRDSRREGDAPPPGF